MPSSWFCLTAPRKAVKKEKKAAKKEEKAGGSKVVLSMAAMVVLRPSCMPQKAPSGMWMVEHRRSQSAEQLRPPQLHSFTEECYSRHQR